MIAESYRPGKTRRVRAEQRRRAGLPYGLSPAGPVIDRLRALYDLGWSCDAIAAWHGDCTAAGVNLILTQRRPQDSVESKMATLALLPVTLAPPPHIPGSVRVPALGAERRVQGLMRLGYSHAVISSTAGVTSYAFTRGVYRRITAEHWRAIDDTYERLSGRRGPSEVTARRAERRGLLPPLAWDDIDNPHERPRVPDRDEVLDDVVVARILAGDWRCPANFAERCAVVAQWKRPYAELEGLTGWKVERYKTRMDGAA